MNKVLQKYGLERDKLYVTAVVKEATPHNRKPSAQEIKRWMPFLEDEIRAVQPTLIVLMGRVAWKTTRFEGVEYLETYHPAAAMRFPEIRKKFEKDMEILRHKMKQRGFKGISG